MEGHLGVHWLSGKVVSDLAHDGQKVVGILDELRVLHVLGLVEVTNNVLQSLAVGHPLLDEGLGGRLLLDSSLHDGRLGGDLAGGWCGSDGGGLGRILALAALGALLAVADAGRGSRNAVVVVNTAHMILQVPLAWESIAGHGTVASFIGAQEGLVAVAVHGMSLTLMAEQAGSGGETGILAGVNLAAVGLQVGVHELAAQEGDG